MTSDRPPDHDHPVPASSANGAVSPRPATDTGESDPAEHRRPADGGDPAAELREKARLRRRLDEVFGDVLPATTSDEREPGHRRGFPLEHYRQSRPPHWGDKA